MEKYLDNKIKELEELLYRDSLSTYGSGLLDAYKDLKEQLALFNVVRQSEQLPNMTLEQSIAKAKPNLDKIKDVDKHLDDIR